VRIRSEYLNPDDPGANYQRLVTAADSSDLVLISSYLSPSYSSASAAAAVPVIGFLRDIARHPRTILVNFGNPYLYQQVPGVATYVVAWGGFPVSQRAAAMALLGSNPISGRLPISIPPFLPLGAGEMRPTAQP
jgi:hypothetical protein